MKEANLSNPPYPWLQAAHLVLLDNVNNADSLCVYIYEELCMYYVDISNKVTQIICFKGIKWDSLTPCFCNSSSGTSASWTFRQALFLVSSNSQKSTDPSCPTDTNSLTENGSHFKSWMAEVVLDVVRIS